MTALRRRMIECLQLRRPLSELREYLGVCSEDRFAALALILPPKSSPGGGRVSYGRVSFTGLLAGATSKKTNFAAISNALGDLIERTEIRQCRMVPRTISCLAWTWSFATQRGEQ